MMVKNQDHSKTRGMVPDGIKGVLRCQAALYFQPDLQHPNSISFKEMKPTASPAQFWQNSYLTDLARSTLAEGSML